MLVKAENRSTCDVSNQDVVLGLLGKILESLRVSRGRVPAGHLVVDDFGAVEDVQRCGVRLEFLQFVSIEVSNMV